MFELLLLAAAGPAIVNRQPVETDCRARIILSALPARREAAPDQPRQRAKPQPGKNMRPCLILASA